MGILFNYGYVINPYHRYLDNKMIECRKCTILWHVNDLKLSHVSDEVLTQEINLMNEQLARKDVIPTICRGKVHNYL